MNSLSCRRCPAGNYCPTAGLATPIPCRDGFICPAGTKDLGQVKRQCPEGSYCRGGNKKRKCPAGSYQDTKAQAYCKNCPVGHWCGKGAKDPVPCPRGTFSNALNITRESKCSWCTPGMYCETQGLNKPTGKCSMGFYCPKRSHTPKFRKCPGNGYRLRLHPLVHISSPREYAIKEIKNVIFIHSPKLDM